MAVEKTKQKILLLLDTHGLLHRAYHALPNFVSKKGEPTGALYGFSSMLIRAIRELHPDYVVAAFDLPGPTFRHATYEKYKAKRPEAEKDLILQLQRAHDVVRAFGIAEFSSPGFEADDILGTIVEQILQLRSGQGNKVKDIKIIIVSGDADTFQLVDDDHVVVYTMRKGIEDVVMYDEKKVNERYGFGPKLLPDYKGLKGDPSDNIIGVRGIGEKTATEIIKHFGPLESLYKKIEEKKFTRPDFLKERVLELLRAQKDDAFFSKTLATIRPDAPIDFKLPKEIFALHAETVRPLFIELGFTSLLERLKQQEKNDEKSEPVASDIPEKHTVKNITKHKKDFLEELDKGDTIYLLKNGDQFFVYGAKNAWMIREQDIAVLAKIWDEIICAKTLVSADIKNLMKIFRRHSLSLPKRYFDCGIAAWVCNSTFKFSSAAHLISEILEREINETMNAAELVFLLPDLYQKLSAITDEREVRKVLDEIEFPLIPILVKMEERGIAIDRFFVEDFKKELLKKTSDLERRIYEFAGTTFNINSPLQIGEVLFNRLGIGGKIPRKTKTGRISTRESELLKLQDQHPVIPLILEYREIAKLLSTYLDPLLEFSKKDGKIHTTFNQTGTVTGRLASEAPNLQNIPIRSELGARVRKAFVASEGFTLAAFDYAQVELKILASFAGDSKMIAAFKKGVDIHRLTAAEINNTSLDQVTKKMRDRAKAINFGIIYGMGLRQLAQSTGMSQADAQKFYQEYFSDFPRIRDYIEKIKKEVRERGYVETLYGRRRVFDITWRRSSRYLEAEMERMAVNAIIQGTDADIMKKAMIEVEQLLDKNIVRPLLQIHDEMIYEIRDDVLKEKSRQIKHIMEHVIVLAAPLTVEVRIGKQLGELALLDSGGVI